MFILQLAKQKRTEELLEELKRVKSNDAAEIMRLKKELATLRQVLRSYVLQIDSLNRANEQLSRDNQTLKSQNAQAQRHISTLSTEKFGLSKAQTDAILEMKLRRLTGLERDKIEQELAELRETIAYLKRVLEDESLVRKTN